MEISLVCSCGAEFKFIDNASGVMQKMIHDLVVRWMNEHEVCVGWEEEEEAGFFTDKAIRDYVDKGKGDKLPRFLFGMYQEAKK